MYLHSPRASTRRVSLYRVAVLCRNGVRSEPLSAAPLTLTHSRSGWSGRDAATSGQIPTRMTKSCDEWHKNDLAGGNGESYTEKLRLICDARQKICSNSSQMHTSHVGCVRFSFASQSVRECKGYFCHTASYSWFGNIKDFALNFACLHVCMTRVKLSHPKNAGDISDILR